MGLLSENEKILMAMDDVVTLRDQTKEVVTKVTEIKNVCLSWKQNCPSISSMRRLLRCAGTRYRNELSIINGEISASRVECANFRWSHIGMVSCNKQS